jgi:hypothetical protein
MSANAAAVTARNRVGIDPLLVGIIAFFLAHMLIRIFGSSNFSVDDTEAAVRTQIFQLYYNPNNPPLFDWLFFAMRNLMGVSNATIQILKTALLTGAGVFLFLAARNGLRHRVAFEAAIVSYGATAFYGWDVFQQFSHTVALIFSIAFTLWALTRVLRFSRPVDYAVLGLGLGLGLLSKYLFALYFLALIIAALRVPAYRPAILSPRLLLTIVVAAMLVLPLVFGVSDGLGNLFSRLGGRVSGSAHGQDLESLGYLALLTAEFWLPLLAILWFCLARWRESETGAAPGEAVDEGFHALVWGATIFMVVAMAISVILGTRITEGRYLVVILSLLPLAIFTALDRRLSFPSIAVDNFRRIGIALIVGVAVFRFLTFLFVSPPFCLPRCVVFVDFRPVAEKIGVEGEKQNVILTHHVHIGANLLSLVPNGRVIIDHYTGASDLAIRPPAERNCYLVWFEHYSDNELSLADAFKRALGRVPTEAELAAVGPPDLVTVGWQTKLPWAWGPKLMWPWGPDNVVGVAKIDSALPICGGSRMTASTADSGGG